VVALDLWADVAEEGRTEAMVQKAKALLDLAREVDPDPWRNRLRDFILSSKRILLQELVRSAPVEELPVATVSAIATWMSSSTSSEEWSLEWLQRAQRRFPAALWINYSLAWVLEHAQTPRLEEAVGYYRVAVAQRPHSPGLHLNLGNVLAKKGDWDAAIEEYREVLRLQKDFPFVHGNLGKTLYYMGKHDEAIACFQEAIRIKDDDVKAHSDLGAVLCATGQLDQGITALREAIRIKRDFPGAHDILGSALYRKGELVEAEAELREAIRLQKDFVGAHFNLGVVLRSKGDVDAAIIEYRAAIGLKPDHVAAHYNLAKALADKGLLQEAIGAYRQSIALKPDYAEAHCNLGDVLQKLGHFVEALASRKRGHELGRKRPDWRYPSAEWVRQAERLVELDASLPRILTGEVKTAGPAEQIEMAWYCQQYKGLYTSAVRCFGAAFTADPQLAENLPAANRYNAACAAALASAGRGTDVPASDEQRASLRNQALEWLRADLRARTRPGQTAGTRLLAHWRIDTDLAGVRDEAALAKLAEAERAAWRQLWAEVDEALKRVDGSSRKDGAPPKRP
jgi:serine/threonine-protein kinase